MSFHAYQSGHVLYSCRDRRRGNIRELDEDLKPEVLLVGILQEVRKDGFPPMCRAEKEDRFWREESDMKTPFEVFRDEYERFCELFGCL